MADIATLGIEVRSESLLRAAQNLDRFAGVTQRVEQRVQGFSTGITSMQGSMNRLSNSVTNAGRVMNGFNSALQVLGIGVAANEMKNYADSWTRMGNKIAAASQSSGVQARSLIELRKGADNARSSLDEYVDLYARIMRNSKGVAKSEQEIADVTNIVSKAFAVGGAAASEQAAGVLQLGQALGSGFLQGDELRSIRENAPVLAQAVADEFGTTIAGLKDLGAEGKLTSDRILKAILNARQQIEAQFNKTSLTIEQSLTLVKNAATQYIGTMDGVTGSSRVVSGTLKAIADNFDYLGDAVLVVSGVIASKLIGKFAQSAGEQIKLTAALLEGNAVMLNGRTAALQKATYIREAALADQQATKAALDLAKAEAVKTKATLEAATAQKGAIFASTSMGKASLQQAISNHALAISDLTAKEKAFAAATVTANRALLTQDIAMAKASAAGRVVGGLRGILSKGLNVIGGPVGAGILAVSAAMYYSSKRAEEARQKSEELRKVWNELGYSAPLAAANIDKITSSIAQMSLGARTAHLKDVREEIERITKSDRGQGLNNLPLIGEKKQDDEFESVLKKANKARENTPEDAKAFHELRDLFDLIRRFPTEVYKADSALENWRKKNISQGLAETADDAVIAFDHLKQAMNDNFMFGGTMGLDKAKSQLEDLKKTVERYRISGLDDDQISQINTLIDQLEKGDLTSQEFGTKLTEIKGIDAFSGLVTDLNSASNSFQFAKEKAEEFKDALEKIKNKTINIAVNMTGTGLVDDALKKAKNDAIIAQENYEKLLKESTKTPAEKRVDAIVPELLKDTSGTLKDSPELRKMAKIIDRNRQAAKHSDKTAQREADAYRDLIKSGQDRIGQLELEAQVAGKAGVAADTLRMKLELEQKATDKGRSITAKKREEIDKLVNSYQKAAEATAKAQLNADLSYRWRQMGRSDIDQSVADTLKQYGLEENLNSIDAANIRLLETTKRNQQAWQRFGDTAEDALYRMISGTDDWRSSLASLLPTLKDLVLQLAGLSDNKNSLGGLLGSYFTGGGNGFFASGGDKIFQAGVAQGFKSNSLANALASGANGLFAQGGVFSPTARLFAKGGAFTNSIVDRPTPFKFADGDGFGNGLMGEAGPEAVMPLKRDARGSLGIAVNGWGRSAPAQQPQEQKTVVVHVEPSDYFDVRVKEIAEQVSQNNIRQFQENMPNIIGQTINEARMKNRM